MLPQELVTKLNDNALDYKKESNSYDPAQMNALLEKLTAHGQSDCPAHCVRSRFFHGCSAPYFLASFAKDLIKSYRKVVTCASAGSSSVVFVYKVFIHDVLENRRFCHRPVKSDRGVIAPLPLDVLLNAPSLIQRGRAG